MVATRFESPCFHVSLSWRTTWGYRNRKLSDDSEKEEVERKLLRCVPCCYAPVGMTSVTAHCRANLQQMVRPISCQPLPAAVPRVRRQPVRQPLRLGSAGQACVVLTVAAVDGCPSHKCFDRRQTGWESRAEQGSELARGRRSSHSAWAPMEGWTWTVDVEGYTRVALESPARRCSACKRQVRLMSWSRAGRREWQR
jgi:hypothetical protein